MGGKPPRPPNPTKKPPYPSFHTSDESEAKSNTNLGEDIHEEHNKQVKYGYKNQKEKNLSKILDQKMSDMIKEKFNLHGFEKLSFKNICNDSIHPTIPKNKMANKYEIPKIKPYKGKEDTKEHLR